MNINVPNVCYYICVLINVFSDDGKKKGVKEIQYNKCYSTKYLFLLLITS